MKKAADFNDLAPLTGLPEDLPSEDLNEAFGEIDELLERWHQRLAVKNLALAKRYLENKLEFVLVIRAGPEAKQYVAVFQRKVFLVGREGNRDGREKSPVKAVRHLEFPLDVGVGASDGYQQPVLIDDVEFMKTKDGIAAPSIVRLQPLNEAPSFQGGPDKPGSNVVSTMLGGRTYWEFGVFGGGSASVTDQAVCQQVQGRPEIVDNVANSPAPPGWDVLDYLQLVDFVSRVRVTISDDEIWISILKGRDFSTKLVKVLLGPVDLYPNP